MGRRHYRAKRAVVYREVLRGPDIDVGHRGQSIVARQGDWIDGILVRQLTPDQRRQLAPGAISPMRLRSRLGHEIDDTQVVVRPLHDGGALSAAETDYVTGRVAVVVCESEHQARADIASAIEHEPDGVFVVDADVVPPVSHVDTAKALLVGLRGGVDVAFPACNLHDPVSLPMVGDVASALPRLRGGMSLYEIADALDLATIPPVLGAPRQPGCALLSPRAARAVAAGESINTRGRSMVVPTVYAWRPAARDGVVARLVHTRGDGAEGWRTTAATARRVVASHNPGRPPVVLYSENVGPWGGVGVLFRLADELQRLGLHAFIAHETTTDHHYRAVTAPLKLRPAARLAAEWARHTGSPDGIIVASHWGSGRHVRDICERNPGVVATSIMQDREDLFETPDGRPIRRDMFQDYLSIGRGAAVASWIVESARSELDLAGSYRVIPPGLDTTVFHPDAGVRPSGGPVRFVSMWRPQTAIRRGIDRLRATYDALHSRFGDGVELHLYGWNEKGSGRAPDYAIHHGTLSQAEVAALVASCHVLVEPSEYQGWGLPGVEALACGTALVSTQCRGPDDYATHEQNALVVPHDDLAKACARVVEDPALLARLQAAARPSVMHLDWRLIGARWAIYLDELWREHGSRRWTDEFAAAADAARAILAENNEPVFPC